MDITKIKQSVDEYRLQLQCSRCGGHPSMVHISPIAEVDGRVFCGIMMVCGCRNMRGLTNLKGDTWIILADFACQGGDMFITEMNQHPKAKPVDDRAIEYKPADMKTSEGLAAWDKEAKSTANDFEKEFLDG